MRTVSGLTVQPYEARCMGCMAVDQRHNLDYVDLGHEVVLMCDPCAYAHASSASSAARAANETWCVVRYTGFARATSHEVLCGLGKEEALARAERLNALMALWADRIYVAELATWDRKETS